MDSPSSKKWFPAKKVGYGWGLPVCWQGYVVLFVYVLLLTLGAFLIFRTAADAGKYVLFAFGLSGMLLLTCYLKGESLN